MQENGKRLLSLLMVVAMLLSMMPVSVGAQELEEEQLTVETVQPEEALPEAELPVVTEPQQQEPEQEEPQQQEPEQEEPQEVILPPVKNQSGDQLPQLVFGQPLDVEITQEIATQSSYAWVEFTPAEDGAYIFDIAADFTVRLVIVDENNDHLQYTTLDIGWKAFQNMKGGHTYRVGIASAYGAYGTAQVTVDNSPLKSITFAPITVLEGTLGYVNTYLENGETKLWYYTPDWKLLNQTTYTATFADGSEFTGSGNRLYYGGTEFGIETSTDQSYENQWVGGNEYTLTAKVMGHEVQIPVTVQKAEVESISVAPISVVQGTCGQILGEWNPDTESYDNQYYDYSANVILSNADYTITYSDGTTYSGYGSVPYEGEYWSMTGYAVQSYENQWTVGNTYSMDVMFLGQHFQVPVTIVDTYIKDITFEPITVLEGTLGSVATGYNEQTQKDDLVYFQYALRNLFWESEYTITFVDDTQITGNDDHFTYNGQHYEMDLSTDQSYENQWTPGGTYALQVEVMGVKKEIPVTIVDVPLESFTIEPLTVVENTRGEIGKDWDTSQEYFKYNPNFILEKAQYALTYTDGVDNGYGSHIMYNDETYPFNTYTDQSYDNQWTAGNTYTIDVFLFGKHIQVPVTVVENPVQDITFDTIVLKEEMGGDWYDEPGGRYYKYDWVDKLAYTITFKDGTILSGTYDEAVVYNGDVYAAGEFVETQSAETPWQLGSDNTAMVRIAGVWYDVNVTIEEYQIPELALDVPADVSAEADQYAEALFTPEVSGGYVFTSLADFDTYGILYEVSATGDIHIAENDDSGQNNNFQITVALEAGKTYKLAARRYSWEAAQFQVKVSKAPLESLTFQPVTIMPNTYGGGTMGWNPETEETFPYYNYHAHNLLEQSAFTATFTDGTVISGEGRDGGFNYNGTWYDFECWDGDQEQTPWTPGNTYAVPVEVLGVKAQIPVTIQESPLQSFTVEPITIIEGTCGTLCQEWNPETDEFDLEYYGYYASSVLGRTRCTATFADGYTWSGCGNEIFYHGNVRGEICGYAYQNYETRWTAGNTYYIDVYLLGQHVQVPVTIEKSPVVSLTADPVIVYENTGGTWNDAWYGDEHFQYYTYHWWNKVDYHVTFSDGTSSTIFDGRGCDYNGMYYSIETSDAQGYENQWTVGNTYTATLTFMGVTTEVTIIVEDSPLESVVFDPITLEENMGGYWTWGENGQYYQYNWSDRITYTVTFKDGTVATGTRWSSAYYDGEYYGIDTHSDDQYSEPWLVDNTYPVQIQFEGKWYETYVTISKTTENNGFTYILQGDKAIINGCTTETEIIQIPEMIDGYQVVGITSLGDAMAYAEELRIPDSVTMLSEYTLDPYAGETIPLKKLVLGKGVPVVSIDMLRQAQCLEEIVVAAGNPYMCSIDGVVYNKDVTQMLVYPAAKQDLHKIPDSVTDIGKVMEFGFAFREHKPNIQFGAGIEDYKMVDGVIYDIDMARVIMATPSATGSYVMPDTVRDIAEYAFSGTNVTSVTVSPKVTYIAYASFHQAINLEEIAIPSSVQYIHGLAFTGCTGLKKVHTSDISAWATMEGGGNLLYYAHDLYLNGKKIVDLVIPETVTEAVYNPEAIAWEAFAYGSFQSVTIPSRIHSIGWNAFYGCENLKKVNISDLAVWTGILFENEQANPLYYAKNLYLNGQKVTNLVVPKAVTNDVYVTSSVYYVNSYAFINANLKKITVPSYVYEIYPSAFEGSSVEQIVLEEGINAIYYSAFSNCGVKSLRIPDSVQYMEFSAFANCRNLEQLAIGSGLQTIPSSAFYNSKLKSVVIPENIEYVGSSAFEGSALEEVTFLGKDVQIGWSAFAGCPLGDLKLGDNITWIEGQAFEGINAYQIQHAASVTEISYRVYAFNPDLVSVTIPDTVTYINDAAFEGDSNLSHVLYTGTEEQWNKMENNWCPELEDATIHFEATGNEVTVEHDCTTIRLFCTICNKWETIERKNAHHSYDANNVCTVCGYEGVWRYVVEDDTVYITGYMGNDTDVTIPGKIEGKTVTSFTEDVFAYNRKLTSVTLPDSITQIPEGAFQYCSSLRKVTLGKKVTTIGAEAFLMNRNLTVINLPNTLTTIGDAAFFHCEELQAVAIPKSVRTIGSMAFYNCESLQRVEIPEGVTEIAYEAFSACWSLREVIIPNTVTSIGYYAFSNASIEEIIIPASVQEIQDFAFIYNEEQTVIFEGNQPKISPVAFEQGGTTMFYPAANNTWRYLPEDYNKWYACSVPTLANQLKNQTVEAGETVTLSVEAYGHRLRYQWYYAAPDATKFNPIGGNSMELTMTVDKDTSRGRVYCVITDVVGQTVRTDTVTLRNPARSTGIHLNQLPFTLEYDLRQELRTRGLEVVLKYDDGTEDPVTDYTITGFDPNRGGKQTLTVSYNGYTATFDVNVNKEKMNFTNVEQKVELSAPEGAVDSDVELVVETVYAETVLPDIEEVPEVLQENESVIFDISLEKEGQTVQPEETVQVSIPVPEHMESKRCKIFYIADDGTATDMNAQYKDGRMVFDTDHFSYYAMVEVAGVTISGKVTGGDVSGAIVKLISGGEVLESMSVNANGTYRFENVVGNDYVIEVSKEGMPTKRQQINVLDQDTILDILLAVIGDLTGDGEVDSLDGLLLLQYLNGWDVEINVEFAMDVNRDGKVDSLDGLLVMRYLNNWGITLG